VREEWREGKLHESIWKLLRDRQSTLELKAEVVGFEDDMSVGELNKRLRQVVRHIHPDKAGRDEELRKELEEKTRIITELYGRMRKRVEEKARVGANA
jgi:preprotein translocase subunit Sec63